MRLQRVPRRRDDHPQAPTSAVAGPKGRPQPRSGRRFLDDETNAQLQVAQRVALVVEDDGAERRVLGA